MGYFSRAPKQTATENPQVSRSREAIISDLAGRINDSDRAAKVRSLPGGEEMVAEAVRRAAQQ